MHQKAGSASVTDLHGRIDEVRCTSCGELSSRSELQARLRALNEDWVADNIGGRAADQAEQRADGDAEIRPDADYDSFVLPQCGNCGSETLKPNVVFFGDNVPKSTVDYCYDQVDASDSILVVGSSLEVYSAFRFVERVLVVDPDDADEDNGEHNTKGGRRRQRRKRPTLATKPICVLNLGATRADRYGVTPLLRVNLPCDEALWECVRPGN